MATELKKQLAILQQSLAADAAVVKAANDETAAVSNLVNANSAAIVPTTIGLAAAETAAIDNLVNANATVVKPTITVPTVNVNNLLAAETAALTGLGV